MITIPCNVGESVVIGDNIIVTVIEVQSDNVRFRIEHLPEAPVRRREVVEAVRQAEVAYKRPR